jgi:hypothetical protein
LPVISSAFAACCNLLRYQQKQLQLTHTTTTLLSPNHPIVRREQQQQQQQEQSQQPQQQPQQHHQPVQSKNPLLSSNNASSFSSAFVARRGTNEPVVNETVTTTTTTTATTTITGASATNSAAASSSVVVDAAKDRVVAQLLFERKRQQQLQHQLDNNNSGVGAATASDDSFAASRSMSQSQQHQLQQTPAPAMASSVNAGSTNKSQRDQVVARLLAERRSTSSVQRTQSKTTTLEQDAYDDAVSRLTFQKQQQQQQQQPPQTPQQQQQQHPEQQIIFEAADHLDLSPDSDPLSGPERRRRLQEEEQQQLERMARMKQQQGAATTTTTTMQTQRFGTNSNTDFAAEYEQTMLAFHTRQRAEQQQRATAAAAGPSKTVRPMMSKAARRNKSHERHQTRTKRQQMKIDAAAVENDPRLAECTFRPKINDYSGGSAQQQLQLKERINQWEQQHQTKLKQRIERKKSREREKLSQCSFKPRIKTKALTWKDSIKPPTSQALADMPVSERLYHGADNRLAVREQAKLRLAREEELSHSYAPKTDRRSNRITQQRADRAAVPTYVRLNQLNKTKAARLHRKRMNWQAQNTELTFKPKINENSDELARSTRFSNVGGSGADGAGSAPVDLPTRLSANLTSSLERKLRRAQQEEEAHRRTHTFKPNVNPCNDQILAESKQYSGAEQIDFVKRQELLKQQAQSKRVVAAHRIRQGGECSFRPDIGNATEVLKQSRHRSVIVDASQKDATERLAYLDKLRMEKNRRETKEQLDARFKFKPTINAKSRALVTRATPFEELTHEKQPSKEQVQVLQDREADFRRKHSFKPQISKTTRLIAAQRIRPDDQHAKYRLDGGKTTRSILQHIEKDKHARERRLDSARKAHEYHEMKECTFHPKIVGPVVKPASGPVLVRGLARFMELKERKKQMDAEQRKREEDAFMLNVHKRDSGDRPFTIAEPFQLTKKDAARVSKLKRNVRAIKRERMRECTFQPQTLEKTNRELLQQLLQDDEDVAFAAAEAAEAANAAQAATSSSSSLGDLHRRNMSRATNLDISLANYQL